MPQRLAVIVLSGLLVAACGSSSQVGSNATAARATGLRLAQCMRRHGVPDFSDPTAVAGGVVNQLGVNPQAPAFQAAQRFCGRLVPGGGSSSGHASGQAMAQALRTSQCMRRHGVDGFPDPRTSPPSDLSGYSAVVSQGGAVLAIPASVHEQAPAFKRAATACNFRPRLPRRAS